MRICQALRTPGKSRKAARFVVRFFLVDDLCAVALCGVLCAFRQGLAQDRHRCRFADFSFAQ
jgi:hypothetical protein